MPSPAPYLRAMTAFVGCTALLATVLLLVSLPVAARADDSLCPQKRMVIVAHQDDDLIFENPGLLEEIAAGDCVRTVFVTAGDAGLGEAYWRDREEGSRVAYATMAGVANAWTTSEPSVAGHNLHVATLVGKPTVSEVYLRLPNGGFDGSGYEATEYKSLPKLWRSHNPQPAELPSISTLSALDSSATYTYEGLLATLEDLIEEFQPDILSTQDFTHEFGTGDHADHITTAKLTQIANGSYKSEHVLRSYMDYESKNHPVNVFEPALAKKLNAYYAYAAHDSNEACASQTACEQPYYADYWAWLKRQIVLAETAVPGADAGSDHSAASNASVTLDGSGSSDPLGHALSYKWTQTGGPAVTLSNSHAVKPSFTAPIGPASLTFSLVVNSSEASSLADSVTVTVAAPFYALKVSKTGNGSGTVTSSPAGISCGSDCEEAYERGSVVTLSPAAAPGSEFKGWSGACTGTGACQVTMSALREVGAQFALQRHQLSVTKSGTGSGTVSSSPAGVNCGTTCAASFDHGTTVTLSGTPASGSKPVAWSGCGSVNGSNQCVVTMSEAKSVTATFELERHSLSVAKGGSGSGTVTSSPAGVNCGTTCAASFDHGTTVTLSGAPAGGSKPVVWETCPGAVNGSNQCVVTMSEAKEARARFDQIDSFQLAIVKGGSGQGTVTSSPSGIACGSECSHSFAEGTTVTLSGTPAGGSKAVAWSGCGSVNGSNQCVVTMGEAKSVTATFELERHSLSVAKGGSGSGTVTSSPAGVNCGTTCAASFDHGTTVTLSGAPAGGSKPVVWETCPGAVNGSNQCVVTMSEAKEARARFDQIDSFQLAIVKGGSGQGTVNSSPSGIACGSECSHSFAEGTTVTLSGAPAGGSKAVAWSGCGSVNGSNQCVVTMSGAKSVTATFDLERHSLSVAKSGSGSGTVTSSPAGVNCGTTCAASFDHGTTVTLSGAPAGGSKPVVWETCPGAVNGSNQCVVTMSEAKEARARFDQIDSFQLAIVKGGSGQGTVNSSPSGIACGSECSHSFAEGTTVTLSGAPASGSKAVAWSGCGSVNGSNQCVVTMGEAKSVTATFDLERHSLSVAKGGSGSGTVTSSPAGIDCGATCAASFDHGTTVTLSGAPAGGSKPVAWSGCGSVNGSNQCVVTMSGAKSVTATFDLERHSLSVAKSGSGSGTVTSSPAGIDCGATCTASFDHGTTVTLSGAPAGGSKPVVWETCPGAVNGSNQCVVTMSEAKEARARFDQIDSFQLAIVKGGSGQGTVNSSPSGIACGSECSHSFAEGTTVTLSGAPAGGSKPVAWSGCGSVNGSNQCVVTMSEAKSVTATFDLERHSLSVAKSGSGSGTVTSSPAGIDCGATCTASFDHGTTVTLSGAPAGGSKPVVWETCPGAVNGSNQCVVTMSEAKEARARFDQIDSFQLAIVKGGSGQGTVNSSPSGIACGSECSHSFAEGTTVTLSGTPASGSKAVAWSGCGSVNGSNQCVVTMSGAKSVTATFELERHSLSVAKSGSGWGTVTSSPAGVNCGTTCAASFDHGTTVTLSGAPAGGSKPVVWETCPGAVNGSNQCVVTMSEAKEARARFDQIDSFQLAIVKGGSGQGTVNSSPSGIACGSECSHSYAEGTTVTLTGAPAAGSKPVAWSGCGSVNGSNQCVVTMSGAKSVTATFELERHSLSVAKGGSGSGTVTSSPAGVNCGTTCAASFDHGTTVTLSGAPAGGSKAVAWSGCGSVNGSNQCVVTMSGAKSVTATFELERHSLTVAKSGSGSGTVTSSPAGIDCGATCAASFDHGTEVTLRVTGISDSEAIIWSGCDEVVGGDECRVTMDGDALVSATVEATETPSTPAPITPAPAATPTPPAPTPPPSWNAPSTKLLKARVLRKRGTAHFVFAARGNATRFHCALSRIRRRLRYTPCASPVTYRGLGAGIYVFKVKAVGPGGADATPVTRKFRVATSPRRLTRHRSRSRRHLRAWLGSNEPLPRSHR